MNYPCPYDSTMLDIGEGTQYFFDDLVIESVENVCRVWHTPVKHPAPLIQKDRPWESIPYFSCNTHQVQRDPHEGIFKCWYTDWNKPYVRPEDSAIGRSIYHILYAESEDGLHWRKPPLGDAAGHGMETNVSLPHGYNMAIVRDPHEPDAQKRYKGLYTSFPPGSADVAAMRLATSADGRRWQAGQEKPCFGRHGDRLDDVIILRYNAEGRFFVINARHYDMYAVARNLGNPTVGHWTLPYYPSDWRRMNKRRVWQAESSDLLHWSEPYPALIPDEDEAELDECFYGLAQYPMGDITLGFLNIYNYVSNEMRVRLVYSRNGKTWHHLNRGQPFLEPGGAGAWDACMVTIPYPPIPVGNELWVYHGGARNHHDWWITGAREGLTVPEALDINEVAYCLGLATMRRDGFVSLSANAVRPGIYITRPVISTGEHLVINAACRAGGSVAVEVVDLRDQVIPGFSKEVCDVFSGDSVSHIVSWQGKTSIPVRSHERAAYPHAENERFRKLRFYMRNADLYSFTLTNQT